VPAIAARSYFVARTELLVPATWRGGTIDLTAMVDPAERIAERDEANNQRRIAVVLPAPGPQLPVLLVAVLGGAAAAALITLAVVRVARKRRGPGQRETAPPPRALTTRLRRDLGEQRIEADGATVALPGLRLRPKADRGSQTIEFEQDEQQEAVPWRASR
jgi:hypothetical protein